VVGERRYELDSVLNLEPVRGRILRQKLVTRKFVKEKKVGHPGPVGVDVQ